MLWVQDFKLRTVWRCHFESDLMDSYQEDMVLQTLWCLTATISRDEPQT